MNVLQLIKKNFGTYITVIGVAAILPVLLMGALSRDRLLLSGQADTDPTLRLWLEPATVVTQPGQSVTFRVMGDYSGDDSPIVPFTVELTPSQDQVVVSPGQIAVDGWLGRKELTQVKVQATYVGSFEVAVTAQILDSSLPNLELVTQPAKLTVR